MKLPLLMITALLAVLAGIASLFDDSVNQPSLQVGELGQTLAKPQLLASLGEIRLDQDDRSMVLKKGQNELEGSGWLMMSEGAFPASFDKVADLVDELTETTYVRDIPGSEDASELAQFGLDKPKKLALKDESGKALLNLEIGSARMGGGQYVRKEGDATVYLVSENLDPSLDTSAWELKELIDVAGEDLAEVEFVPNPLRKAEVVKKPVAFSRKTAGEEFVVSEKPNLEPTAMAANQLKSLLSGVRYDRRFGSDFVQAQQAFKQTDRVVAKTFAGDVFAVTVGEVEVEPAPTAATDSDQQNPAEAAKPEKKHFIRISHSIEPRGQQDHSAGSVDTAAVVDAEALAMRRQRYDLLNRIMGEWAFEVSSYTADKFRKGLSELTQEKQLEPKEDTLPSSSQVSTPTASSDGAENSVSSKEAKGG